MDTKDTPYKNGDGEVLPWETETKQEPLRGSLEYMQLHLKELITLRAGRKLKTEPEINETYEQARELFQKDTV